VPCHVVKDESSAATIYPKAQPTLIQGGDRRCKNALTDERGWDGYDAASLCANCQWDRRRNESA
jgi:hypothetical protein